MCAPSFSKGVQNLGGQGKPEQGRGKGPPLLPAATLLPVLCTGWETATQILLLPAQPAVFSGFTSVRTFSRRA